MKKPTKIQRIATLLNGLKKRKISAGEQEELDEWFHSLHVEPNEFDNWVNEAGGEEIFSEELLIRFNQKLAHTRKRKNNFYYWAAASLLIMLSAAFFMISKDSNQSIKPNNAFAKNVTAPGGNRAVLTMGNGDHVNLNDKSVGYINKQGDAQIYKAAAGKLVYNRVSSQSRPVYNTLITPRAGQYELELPDGTRVWLNAESSLRFPTSFSGRNRTVELTGEAYFEVAHNAKMPFKVRTANQEITVLGTHFNIQGYKDESAISTTLLQGSVSVMNKLSGKASLLVPGKQSTVYRNNGEISVHAITVDQVMAWKNGYFIFENEDIQTIMKLISRWYDVDVEYHKIEQVRLGGTFSKSSDLAALLKSFELISDLKFNIKGRRVTVTN